MLLFVRRSDSIIEYLKALLTMSVKIYFLDSWLIECGIINFVILDSNPMILAVLSPSLIEYTIYSCSTFFYICLV